MIIISATIFQFKSNETDMRRCLFVMFQLKPGYKASWLQFIAKMLLFSRCCLHQSYNKTPISKKKKTKQVEWKLHLNIGNTYKRFERIIETSNWVQRYYVITFQITKHISAFKYIITVIVSYQFLCVSWYNIAKICADAKIKNKSYNLC